MLLIAYNDNVHTLRLYYLIKTNNELDLIITPLKVDKKDSRHEMAVQTIIKQNIPEVPYRTNPDDLISHLRNVCNGQSGYKAIKDAVNIYINDFGIKSAFDKANETLFYEDRYGYVNKKEIIFDTQTLIELFSYNVAGEFIDFIRYSSLSLDTTALMRIKNRVQPAEYDFKYIDVDQEIFSRRDKIMTKYKNHISNYKNSLGYVNIERTRNVGDFNFESFFDKVVCKFRLQLEYCNEAALVAHNWAHKERRNTEEFDNVLYYTYYMWSVLYKEIMDWEVFSNNYRLGNRVENNKVYHEWVYLPNIQEDN